MKEANILVIGNGFDLAHGLPTKYIEFINCLKDLRSTKGVTKYSAMVNALKEWKPSLGTNCNTTYNFKQNIWLNYFEQLVESNSQRGDNWIDFECEIAEVIENFDKLTQNLSTSYSKAHTLFTKSDYYKQMSHKATKLLKTLHEFMRNTGNDGGFKSLLTVRNLMIQHLEEFAIIFTIYLQTQVQTKTVEKIKLFEDMVPDLVFTYNYTDTYKHYSISESKVHHLHGKCMELKEEQWESNIVLGIHDYWIGDEADNNTNYAVFMKYIQKLIKVDHVDISSEIEKLQTRRSAIAHIYGHSLNITDKDSLKPIFLNTNKIKVYFLNEESRGQLLANIIKIIGKEKTTTMIHNQELEFVRI